MTFRLWRISSSGSQISSKPTEVSQEFSCLGIHPIKNELYGGFNGDNTVRSINLSSRRINAIVVTCNCRPDVIKVLQDDRVLVATNEKKEHVYLYKLTGKLVLKSTEEYSAVYDIDHCKKSKNSVISCGEEGVVVLDPILAKIYTLSGRAGPAKTLGKQRFSLQYFPLKNSPKFVCTTAIFYTDGKLIVSTKNKELCIIGKDYTILQKLPVEGMSKLVRMHLYENILWLECRSPRKIMCIEILNR